MKKPRLSYSNTNYNVSPPEDINNLFIKDNLLAIVSKEGMKKRLASLNIETLGIWELKNLSEVDSYSNVIIVGRNRIHPIFEDKVRELEKYLNDTNNG